MADKNRGKKFSEEHKEKQSISAQKSWENKNTEGNKKRIANLQKYTFKKGNIPYNKGKKSTQKTKNKALINNSTTKKYEVYFNEELIYWCYGHTLLEKFCKKEFNISRTIIWQIVDCNWQPTFNKHKYLNSLKILRLDKGVSTNGDECNQVEWRKQPFEAHSPFKKGMR